MHPEDMMIIGIGLVVLSAIAGVIVVLAMINRRKHEAKLQLFRDACTALGLEHSEDGWFTERFGQKVSVSWGQISAGHVQNAVTSWYTVYTADLDPPLSTGLVLYTGVEHYGLGTDIHVAKIEYWNELPLPGGGTLWDVERTPSQTRLKHIDVRDETLKKRVCVYGRDADRAQRLLVGELAETIVTAAGATSYMWFDDSRLILLVSTAPRTGDYVLTSGVVNLDAPHHSREPIDHWLDKTAAFANAIRRLSA